MQLPEAQMRDIRGRRISIIFQEPSTSLNPVMTVGRQITEVIERHTPLRGDAALAKAIDWLKRVGIPEPERRVDDYPFQMSGGQKQRVMIAMALACRAGHRDRRRADHRARRDDSGADPRPAERAAGVAARWRCCSSRTISRSSRRWRTASR